MRLMVGMVKPVAVGVVTVVVLMMATAGFWVMVVALAAPRCRH